jgi:DNA-binding response OmpR family regulator
MPAKKSTALVVDDDIRILRMVQRMLELEGFQVLTAPNGNSALAILDTETPDVVLLDIMMPDIDGYTVCKTVREFSQVPIIMVTAKGNEEEKVKGLDCGADDYVTKPFSAGELVARVKAVLRRYKLSAGPQIPAFQYDKLRIDFARHMVFLDDKDIELTATEYQLLAYMARNAGMVLTPDQLLKEVWGEDYIGETHILQVNIARLRHKLNDDPKDPKYILTRHGIGYMIKKSM